MLIPKKISDGLQCVLCGAEIKKISPMQDCEKNINLFAKLISEFSLQAVKDCEKIFKRVLSEICAQCYIVSRTIYEFRMRSLASSQKLRMKYMQAGSEQQTSSSAGESWLKIIDVISQSGSDVSRISPSPDHKAARKRLTRIQNGSSHLLNDIKKEYTNGGKGDENGGSPRPINGFDMSTRGRRRSHVVDLESKLGRKTDHENLDDVENSSKSSRVSSLNQNFNMCRRYSPNSSCTSDNIEIENILNHNDMLEVHENEILNHINDNHIPTTNARNNTYHASPISKGSSIDGSSKGSRSSAVNSKPIYSIDDERDIFPMMPENHPPLLEVLYTTPVESALETESGGRVDKQNDVITSASRKQSSTCAFCHKFFRTRLILNKHLVTAHIHDKRRAMKEHREQKAADKSNVCNICHSSFRTEYMLKKHEKSHKRYSCEVCNAEYANPMDFTWHVAKCSGANRSQSEDNVGVWTRSRSRQSSTPGLNSSCNEIDIDYNDNVSILDTEQSVLSSSLARANKLSAISKKELEKWVEETKKVQTTKTKKKRTTRRRKNDSSQEKQLLTDECDEEVANLNLSWGSQNARAPTPFPIRRSSMSSVAESVISSRAATPYSQISGNNMENWDRFISDVEDFDEAGSVCSGFTAVSTGYVTDIESQLSFNSSLSSCGRNKSRESIMTDMSTLSTRPRTRNVTKVLKQLELELRSTSVASAGRRRNGSIQSRSSASHNWMSNNQSRTSMSETSSHRRLSTRRKRRSKRSAKSQNDGFNALIYECMEISCSSKFNNIDTLMDHEEEAHKLLKLFFCKECKKKFTCQKYLDLHLMTHDSEPYICIYCDNNTHYINDLNAHFELHKRHSVPCRQENCCKRFLKPLDFTIHRITYNQRHITHEQEKNFVRQCLKQRAVEQGLEYLKHKKARRRIRRTSSDSSVDMDTQRKFTKLLKDMHSQGKHINLTKMTPTSVSSIYDYGIPYLMPSSTQNVTSANSSLNKNIDYGVCDSIMNGDAELYHLKVIPTPSEIMSGNEVSSSFEETTESEFDQASLKSLSTRRKRKRHKINLSSKRNRSKHVVTLRYFERDLSQYTLPSYSDIKNTDKIFNNFITIDDRAKPWRIFL